VAAGDRPRLDSNDLAGGRSVHGCTERPGWLCQNLALEHAFADPDERLGRVADMLIDRQDQLPGQRE
jgi:hypothetical protein